MRMSLFISSGYCVLLAFMILVLPLQWIMPAMIAAFFHELAHYLAIRACSHKNTSVHVYSFAAQMILPEMSKARELLCALAGPIGGASLIFLAQQFPRLAICAMAQSLYNLLPVYPLDGGRALRCILQMLLLPSEAEFLEAFIMWLTIGLLLLLSLYCFAILQMGLLPLLATIFLAIRAKDGKMPCKADGFAVQ